MDTASPAIPPSALIPSKGRHQRRQAGMLMHTTLGRINRTQGREVDASRRGALTTAPPPHAPRHSTRDATAPLQGPSAVGLALPRHRATARVKPPHAPRHRSCARHTAVAAPLASRRSRHRTRNVRPSIACGTTVAAPHAARPSQPRTRHGRRGTARVTVTALTSASITPHASTSPPLVSPPHRHHCLSTVVTSATTITDRP
jgi:hypothetical protein